MRLLIIFLSLFLSVSVLAQNNWVNAILKDSTGNNINIGSPTSDTTKVLVTNSVDQITGAINILDYEHHEIHGGSHFYVSGFETIDDGDSAVFSITTPAGTKWTHLIFEIKGTSQTEFYIYEDANTTGGNSVTPLNNNRNSIKTSGNTLRYNPTTTTTGGSLIYMQSSGLAGTNRVGASEGITDRSREIILKADSEYRFVIISRDDDNIVSFVGEWYEHTNK